MYTEIKNCRVGGGSNLITVLSLGEQYLTGVFPKTREEVVSKGPLDLVWCPEEPMNQGAWYQVQHHLRACLQPGQSLDYTGRERSAAPACGHLATHVPEQAALIADALFNPADGDHVAE